jgi:hypothetical protein
VSTPSFAASRAVCFISSAARCRTPSGSPSPHTVFGQKGSGEAGYLGAPAAIASAVNDALRPLALAVNNLPIRMTQLADMIAAR